MFFYMDVNVNTFNKGERVMTSAGPGHISQVVFDKDSHKPIMYYVALDENYDGANEIQQSTMQLEKL